LILDESAGLEVKNAGTGRGRSADRSQCDSVPNSLTKGIRRSVLAIALGALVLRVVARTYSGSEDFWRDGYTFYFQLAQSIAAGTGLSFNGHTPTAFRVPVYSTFLAAVTFGHKMFLPVVFAQSLIGAATVLCSALLAAELFGPTAAVISAAATAVYPYYVIHDTALQETCLFTLLTLVSVVSLLQARRSLSAATAALSGLTLAADVLTRATILPFAVMAPFWLGWAGVGMPMRRLRAAAVCAAVIVVTLAPWLIRSYVLTGSLTLSTETGSQLWAGNNPYTFDYYPVQSIDLSAAAAVARLSMNEKAELRGLPYDSENLLVDRWFLQKALTFIRQRPWLTIGNGVRKIRAAFSLLPSPRRSFWPSLIYFLSYGPIMTLGLLGMILNRHSWREHSLIYALFFSFVIVTAAFFGHTSHRSYLDVYWITFSAYIITRWFRPLDHSVGADLGASSKR
jgi:hypothetical protein